jgi:hypothetical protein
LSYFELFQQNFPLLKKYFSETNPRQIPGENQVEKKKANGIKKMQIMRESPCSLSFKKFLKISIQAKNFFYSNDLTLQSNFFPVKIPFSKIPKKILAGKNLLCKETRSFLNWTFLSIPLK